MDRAMSNHLDGSTLVHQYKAELREKIIKLPGVETGFVRLEDVLGALR